MVVASGIGSQFGFSLESGSYGTYTAPTKFVRHKSCDISPKNNRAQGEGIQANTLGPLGAHYVETSQAAEASLALDIQTTVMGLLMQAITGGTSTHEAVTGSTGAYASTHTLADNYGKSYTLQSSRPPRSSGSVVPSTMKGGKVTSADFSCEANGLLTATLAWDGRSWDNSTALATASYVASSVFSGKEMAFKAGTYNSEAAVSGVRSVSVSWKRPMDTEDYTANATGLKGEPVMNDVMDITGTVKADYIAKTDFEDLAYANTPVAIVWEFVKTTAITGTTYPTWRMRLPGCYFDATAQGIPGRSELTTDWAFTWRYDGTNMPSIYQITTDAAL